MSDIDDKLNAILFDNCNGTCDKEVIEEIKEIFKHGVCADCKLMEKDDFCVFLRREIKLPEKQSCSEFEPKVKK